MRTYLFIFLGLVNAPVMAGPFCQWEVSTLDNKTREVKTYQPGPNPMDLPLRNLGSFKSCQVSPVKEYVVDNVNATRIDFWCFTKSGDAVNIGSVASTRFGSDVTTFQLLAGPVSLKRTGGGMIVNASNYVEINAACK